MIIIKTKEQIENMKKLETFWSLATGKLPK